MVRCGADHGGVQELIKLDDNLERFLLCSSFSKNDTYNYESKLTDDLFFDQLYVQGGNLENKIHNEILELIKYGRKQSIFLLGNKGCGKTTLVHKIMQLMDKETELRHICLDFGNSSSTLTLKREQEILIQEIYKMFREAVKFDNIKLLESFLLTYTKNEEEFDVFWDYNNKLDGFYETLRECISNQEEDLLKQLKYKVRPKLAELELFQLFLVLVLVDLQKQQCSTSKRTAIIFDNLDNLLNIADISKFIENFCNFQNNVGSLLKTILKTERSRFQYTFIFVMRETTKANISPHSLEMLRISSKEYDITTLFPKRDIIIKRLHCYQEYLLSQDEKDKKIGKLRQQINSIFKIINDTYMHKTIFPFYNNDYRICVMKLIDITKLYPTLVSQYNNLVSQNNEDAKFGGRGIVYRIILSDLQKKGYFSRLMIVDFLTREKHTSLVRLLLTYLANKTKSDCTDATPAVSLKELFKAFKDIKPSEIIECIWAMFDLITTNDWNHLITFASSKSASKERLYIEKGIYSKKSNKDDDKEYSKFRITCAGEIYLSNVCTHYEFFSCRALGDEYLPLFCMENLEIRDGKYIFEDIIEGVYNQVYRCCLDLCKSFESDQGLCREPRPPYNYKNEAIYQYHSERIIFSHIGYLDSYRCYLLKNATHLDIDIEKVSKLLLETIRKYCNLIVEEKVAKCAATRRFNQIVTNLKEAESNPCDPTKTINRKL